MFPREKPANVFRLGFSSHDLPLSIWKYGNMESCKGDIIEIPGIMDFKLVR